MAETWAEMTARIDAENAALLLPGYRWCEGCDGHGEVLSEFGPDGVLMECEDCQGECQIEIEEGD
jgi:hypothetical protein